MQRELLNWKIVFKRNQKAAEKDRLKTHTKKWLNQWENKVRSSNTYLTKVPEEEERKNGGDRRETEI